MKKKFMVKGSKLLFVAALAIGLSACAATITSNDDGTRSISNEHLSDGTPVKYGNVTPTSGWQCTQVTQNSYKWSLLKTEGQFTHWNGAYGELKAKALEYASDNHLKINYIYWTAPTTASVGNVDVSAASDADETYVYYYQCQFIDG